MINVTFYSTLPFARKLASRLIEVNTREMAQKGYNLAPSGEQEETLLISLEEEGGCTLFVHRTNEPQDMIMRGDDEIARIGVNVSDKDSQIQKLAERIYTEFKVLRSENAEGTEELNLA